MAIAGASAAAYAAVNGDITWSYPCAALLGALLSINGIAAPLLYGLDKRRAVVGRSRDRIPETTLHGLTLSGGAIGAYISARLFRHKISKRSFQLRFWLLVPASLGIYYLAITSCC